MLAIPVNSKNAQTAKLAPLFGNAKQFAFIKGNNEISIKTNSGCGNGFETAKFLLEEGTTSALYLHLGKGPYKALIKAGVNIYYAGENIPLDLQSILIAFKQKRFELVSPQKADTLLDSGNSGCACTCSH